MVAVDRLLWRALLVPFVALAMPALVHGQGGQYLRREDLVVAGVRLRTDSASVRRLLGQPDSITKGDDPSEASGELLAWWYRDLEIVFLNDGRVLGEWIRGPSRSTARGLRLGKPRAEGSSPLRSSKPVSY